MKKSRFASHREPAKKSACTISAAALMLGVSQAATVGFNFQCNYCGAHSYSGAVVTAPAFGIGTNAWESLPQMDTGYGCPAAYYTLDQVIDNTTLPGTGLNPLPQGSIHVTWSGYTANVSGFGGYSRTGPHYNYGGNTYKPGNEQVYWGFIRDGVNFGPGSSGGDNNQPGYNIDITGLKSLFPSSPFAVQLISSADSMQYLTNAFIIDATANTTQSVFYPSTPPVGDSGDTSWVRGVGGGLSTASGAVDTDHLVIRGNRAAHTGDKVTGYNFASTIAGFIITDKPVVTMPPNPVVASPGDTVVWSAYAVGVPPLSYQWRKNGAAIPGATSPAFGITNITRTDLASYDLMVTNNYGSATTSPVSVDSLSTTPGNNFVVDSNPSGPEHDGLNYGATWQAASTDSASLNRNGVMKFSATAASQIVVPAATNLNTTAGSIAFWTRTSGPTNTAAANGSAILDRRTSGGMLIVLNGDGTLTVKVGGDAIQSTGTINDNKWHHVAVTYDESGTVNLYIDGAIDGIVSVIWSWPATQELELGLSHDAAWQPYDGLLDDVRIYSRLLTGAELGSIKSTDAIVDSSALQVRLNFSAAPTSGVTLRWQCPDAILQSADSVAGPYTDVPGVASPYPTATQKTIKFYRYRGHSPATVISNPYLM